VVGENYVRRNDVGVVTSVVIKNMVIPIDEVIAQSGVQLAGMRFILFHQVFHPDNKER
jgi:hypothetical protein